MVTDQEFQRILTLERRRAKRSRRPFLLMLLHIDDFSSWKKDGKVLEKILVALSGSIRGTDVAGWYKDNCVLGVMFTEFGLQGPNSVLRLLITRLTALLSKNLNEQQFDKACISYLLFPEECNPHQPTDPDAPVYAPLGPKPRLRSGGAMAVPEPDDAAELDNSPSISPRLL